MKKPLLSICIPTYNRSSTLKILLDSIIGQDTDELQIVISDNGSTDKSTELIENYRSYFHNYKVNYFDRNMGFTSNILKVVEVAEGDYCWVIGSDDAILSGAIKEILVILKSKKPNLFVFNCIKWNFESTIKIKQYWISKSKSEFKIDQADSGLFGEYLDIANSLGSIFSYISTSVFKRDLWTKYRDGNEMKFFGHPHSYLHIKNVLENGHFYYKNCHLVYSRFGGEDSALELSNPHKRVLLDLQEFKEIFELVTKNELLLGKFNGLLKRYFQISSVIKVFHYGQYDKSLSKSFELFESIGFSRLLLSILLLISKPRFIQYLGILKSNLENLKYQSR
jgi:abequosyltransferase